MTRRGKRGGRTTPKAGGISGDFTGSCIVCFRGTDTAIGFEGQAEWAAAGLINLGVPKEQAGITVSHGLGCELGEVPGGRVTVYFRVCQKCADLAGAPVGLLAAGVPLPTYVQPPIEGGE